MTVSFPRRTLFLGVRFLFTFIIYYIFWSCIVILNYTVFFTWSPAHMRGCNSEERCSLPANIKRSDSEDSIRNSNPQFTKASTSPEVHVQSSKPQVAEEGRNVQGPSV
jgi:hypothetical protein